MFHLLSLHRRAYNLAIEHFKTVEYKQQLGVVELRRNIKAQCELEWEDQLYRAEVAGEAVRAAATTRQSIIRKRMKGGQCDYKFKSIKETNQYFTEQRLTKKFMSMFFCPEILSDDSFGRTTKITYKNGRWFVCALESIKISLSAENQGLKIASIDPGVRTFATVFDGEKAVKYGAGFYAKKVFPLLLKMDKWIGERQRFASNKDNETQSFQNSMKFFEKKIFKLKNRIEDLTFVLHRRIAFDLVQNNDVILLPTFETKNMSRKAGRKIHSKTVRSMLGLGHYAFKQTLQWMCKKYGKTLVEVNEAYTSKTMSWNGHIKENLNGNKVIPDGVIRVDRDINGARNILLRALVAA
jgi:putative transposase